MGLFDRFRNKPINFAEGTSISKVPTGGASELGVAGEAILQGFENEEARIDDIKVSDYVKMRQKDGTVASLYNLMTLPILSTATSFVPDDNDSSGEQSKFIQDVFEKPPHQGGMVIPFSIVKADMLRAVIEGFRVYELVYGLTDDNMVTYTKIAPRDGSKTEQSILLKRNDKGDYDGFHQRVTYHGDWKDVEVPSWKSFLFTYAKDKNYLYGESAFKAAYYHYQKKHKLYYLAELAVQVGAVPPKIVTGPAGKETAERTAILRVIDKLGIRTTAYVPEGYTLEPYKSGEGRIDPMPLIDHHDTQMARSILAQFLMLGTTAGSKGGSHALSSDQSALFIQALKGVMSTIEDHVNFYLIPNLIDLNFAEPAYPTFHFEDITSDTKQLLTDAFTKIVTSGSAPETMIRGIVDRIAEALDIDLEAEQAKLDKEAEKKIADAKAKGVKVDAMGNPLPVVVAPDPTNPKPKDSGNIQPVDQKVINQSDEAADDGPKGSISVASGTGHSAQPKNALTLLR